MRTLSLVLVALAACGDTALVVDQSPADLAAPDLLPAPDLSMPDFAGVACGAMTCGMGQDCCIQPSGMSLAAACMPTGSCAMGTNTAQLMCDGPEDCPSTMADCCLNSTFDRGGDAGASGTGQTACINHCVASITIGAGFQMGSVHTRMCHNAANCAGYGGTIFLNGSVVPLPFTSCCTSPQTGPVQFCAPAMASTFGFTCQ